MFKCFVFSLTVVCAFLFTASVAESHGIPKWIYDSIQEHGDKIWGIVNKKVIVEYGDLNGDGREDIAVLYIISGACGDEAERLDYKPSGVGYLLQGSCGNSFRTYLSVWLDSGKVQVPPIPIADTGLTTAIRIVSMEKGTISIDVLENSGFDPNCCPSVKATLQFSLRDNRLHKSQFQR